MLAPSRANAWATARPTPADAPVITTTSDLSIRDALLPLDENHDTPTEASYKAEAQNREHGTRIGKSLTDEGLSGIGLGTIGCLLAIFLPQLSLLCF
jgi:hypothetical protein